MTLLLFPDIFCFSKGLKSTLCDVGKVRLDCPYICLQLSVFANKFRQEVRYKAEN